MKSLTVAIIIALVLIGCGSDTSTPETPQVALMSPPGQSGTVDISCASVDNDQKCAGLWNGTAWESGPVQTSGDPMPMDWLNVEITNNSIINATVFVVGDMTITGCDNQWNPIVPFQAVELMPGESATFSSLSWNYRCGALGYQDGVVSIYNVVGFDPAGMEPADYPRTDLITSAVVEWDNRIPGDM